MKIRTFVHGLVMTRAPLLVVGLMSVDLCCGCTTSRSDRAPLASNRPRAARLGSETSTTTRRTSPEKTSKDLPASDASGIVLTGGAEEPALVVPVPAEAKSPSAPDSEKAATSPTVPVSRQLSLADLEAIALQNNPTLAQAQAGIDVEQGVYRQAGLYPNPQIGYLNGTASNPSVKQSNGIFLSQEFVTAHKLDLDQQAALQEIKRFQWDLQAQCMRVLNDLRIRYYEVLGAQEAIAVAQQLEKIATENLRVAERLFAAKQGTRSDVLQAKVQLETVRLNLEDAEHRHAAAWEQLATITGMPPMQPVPLVGDLEGDIPQLDLETCWQDLLSRSPQLRSTESELDHGWAVYRSARAQAIPNITLQSVIEYDKATQATTASTLVALPLPLYNRNQGNIDKALADVRTDQAEIRRVQLVLRDQMADSFRRYQSSLRQTERLKQAILPNTEENLKLATQLYVAGETAFTPVLLAQQSYFESRVAYVEAVTELHKVVTEINGLQLTGGLNPAAIGSAIQTQPGGSAQRQRALLNEVQDRAAKQLLPAAQIGR
jgi:cobalt-zinc-cadmium efflux system outer membrane protein